MMFLRTWFLLVLLVLLSPFVSAQMVVSPLASPEFGSAGGGTTSEDSPFSDRFNPASSAGKQRVTFDSSYFGLVGVSQSGFGNAFNLGLTVPERWAVLTGTASYLGSNFNNLNVGNQGRVTFAVSKDLWEDLYIGANLDTAFGTGGWALGTGFGFLHFLGDWGWAKDFRWGASFLDLGNSYTVNGIASPPPFTPALGAQFSPWKDPKLQVQVKPELTFPSFQDINLSLGSTVLFGDNITVNLAYRFDLRDTLAGTNNAMPFSFGVGFHFFTDLATDTNDVLGLKEKGWNRSEVQVSSAAVPLTGGVWALGAGANIPLGVKDTTAPVVSLNQITTYISPTNHEGVRNSLVLPVSITDERYVMGYTLKIFDSNKSLVRTIQNKVTLPEAQGFDQIWNRLTYVKHGIDVPKALEWNGTTDAGTVAPDGSYTMVVTAWDDNGNTKDWPAGTVVVKTVPPQAAVSAPITEFNPVGPRNTLSLVQRGSSESLWTGTFANSRDQVVLTKTWKNAAPNSFDWDGKGNDGRVVTDGVYSYTLSASDEAGNKTVVKVGNLIVNSIPTPLDLKLSRTAFSPGGNGVKTVTFQPQAGVVAGLTGWKLQVQDQKGNVYRTLSGVGVVPPELAYNGKDEGGNPLSEGEYQAKLTLTYSNGNVPEVLSPPFTVKNTPPQATVTAPYQVFSPGSEEGRGVLVFNQNSTEEDSWTGILADPAGKVLRTVRWPGKADATYLWDGRGSDGSILPDGQYFYHIEAVDKAGNTGVSPSVAVQIDTAQRSVLLASDRSAFTPMSQGNNRSVRFTPQLKEPRGLTNWSLTVQDAGGQSVRTWSGTTPPSSTDWDGKDDQGHLAPDGIYTALLKTVYGNGTTPAARSNTVILKNSLPSVTVTADSTLFSPTVDSSRPTLTLKQTSSDESEWVGTISKGGSPVKTFRWKGEVHDAVWDGTDDAGNKVPDGAYRYEIKTTDVADNTVAQSVDNLTVDTRPTPLFVTVGADGFSPNGSGVADTITLRSQVGLNEGIDGWRLEINDDALGLRKTFQGRGPVPSQWVWDGTTDQGGRTEDGRYSATLSVTYTKGNHPSTRSAGFVVQAAPPQLSLDLTPQPFSPDNDGYNDELLINLGVKSLSPVASWSLEILDPANHRFILFDGQGAPSAQLKWDGRSGTGELVQSASDYTAIFTAKDGLGNTASVTKPLAVDVLVMKDGDRLRIIIPSITFAPNSPDFLTGIDPDKVAKNIAVLKRVAEIFTKYQRYKIGIEGHAVMINWADPAKGQKEQDGELVPLSQKRADAVKAYLATLGIAAARVSTEGIGGARPIVPFSDLDNRWKDRRVEFWLDRE